MDAPELDLDWEEGLFRAMRGLWRRLRPKAAPKFDAGRAAVFESWQPRLELLGRLVGPKDLQVNLGRSEGGLRGHTMLLPPFIDLGPDPQVNGALYLLRGVLGARLASLDLPHSGQAWADAWALLDAVASVLPELFDELPRLEEVWQEAGALVLAARPEVTSEAARCFETAVAELLSKGTVSDCKRLQDASRPPAVLLWGRLMADVKAPAGPQEAADDEEGSTEGQRPESEAEMPQAVEDLVLINLDQKKALELPTHVFEKVETAEAFNGTLRQLDGEDDLDDQLEALEEVQLGHLVRGGPEAQAMLRAEVGLEVDVPDVGRVLPGEKGLPYDEWDGRKGVWRRGWCTVYPTAVQAHPTTPWVDEALVRHRRLVDETERTMRVVRSRPRVQPRQLQGEEVDVDAWVNAWGDRHATGEGSRRLYRAKRPAEREVATLVLMDLSLSADSWVSGLRVLDVCREAVLVLGEVSERLGDPLAIMGFASNTRNHVRTFDVKDWNEPWSLAKRRLEGLRPQGYTRIGPALRHSGVVLDRTGAQRRQLLILTDGKPTDYDRYEGRYGLADVRRAMRDLREDGVLVHALAIDRKAQAGLSAMCGPGGWDLLPDPSKLPAAMGRLLARRAGRA